MTTFFPRLRPLLLLAAILALCSPLGATMLPEPDGRRFSGPPSPGDLTEADFSFYIAAVQNEFSGTVSRHDARLVMEKNWNDNTVNLYAEQMGMTWFIHAFGGYARLPKMTRDAFQLSLCHELGHHLSGFPYKTAWSSAEGQADYFATHACLNRLWGGETGENRLAAETADPVSKRRCAAAWGTDPERWLCARKAAASLTLVQAFAAHLSVPAVDPASSSELPAVAETFYGHPSLQCRFETLIRGALCAKPFDLRKIPGKTPAQVVPVPAEALGSNAAWAERESARSVCVKGNPGEEQGARPACWFFDRLH